MNRQIPRKMKMGLYTRMEKRYYKEKMTPRREKSKKLLNYDYITRTRQLGNNWGEVKILSGPNGGNLHKRTCTLRNIQRTDKVTILGIHIQIHGEQGHAIKHRLAQARKHGKL